MKNNRIEEFDNFEIEPTAEVWKRIEQRLPPERKRRWFLYWLLPLFIIVSGGMIYIKKPFVYSDKKDESKLFQSQNKFSEVDKTGHHDLFSSNQIRVTPSENSVNNKNNIRENSGLKSEKNKSNDEHFRNQDKGLIIEKQNYNSWQTEGNNTMAGINTGVSKEEYLRMKRLKIKFPDFGAENNIISRDISEKKNCQLSRWSIYASIGFSLSGNKDSNEKLPENYSGTIEELNDIYYAAGVKYDLSPRIKLAAGVSFISMGQKSSSGTEVILRGQPGDPDKTYSLTSPLGNITGMGDEFDLAFYNNSDSSLFPVATLAGPVEDSSSNRYINLRQEFRYVEVPLTIMYKPMERRITPYAGIYFSAGFLISNQIYLNDKRLYYEYEDELSDYIFSAGLTAGFDIRLTRTLSFSINGFYQEGLSSIFKSNTNWKPYAAGVGGGVSYRFCK